ncbi:hypothetical protein BTVI_158947 [Pitangus sulphuratus]|nr:hypothetical protein BTVI_158947 [Pitangus sulphuratus]
MAAVLFGFEDLLYSWDSLVWSLTSRALRTCRFGNLRVLQLMLKPWCISRDVYQLKQLLYTGGVSLSVTVWDKPSSEMGILSPFGNGGIAYSKLN